MSYVFSLVLLLTFALSEVKGYPTDSLDRIKQGFRDVVLSSDEDYEETVPKRSKRAAEDNLQAYRDQLLLHLNEYRREHNLPEFQVDPALETSAQSWAVEEARKFEMSSSCEQCADYAEILGKRRSSHQIADGQEAGEWVYMMLFEYEMDEGETVRTFDSIRDDPAIDLVGFGLAFKRNPEDRSFHAYPVLRLSKPTHH